MTRERYKAKIIAGLCGRCGQSARRAAGFCISCSDLPLSGLTRCKKHWDMHLASTQKRKREVAAKDLCICCHSQVSRENKRLCPVCSLDYKIRHKKWHFNLKLQVIKGYGGKCQCPRCGITTPEFLTLDHINNDGALRRKMLGNKEIGATLYQRLIKEGFPRGVYQLLCLNCNGAKSFFGKCPHTEQTNCMAAAGGA